MVFNIEEALWYILVPLTFLILVIFKKWVKRIGVLECSFPVTTLCIEMIGRLFVQYSILPYILFAYVWIAIVLFFYNYKTNYYFTVTQFFKRVFKVISFVNILVWLSIAIVRVVSMFLVQ
ncbi:MULTISPECIES: hypothetical protein [unclassified Granulicatella]|uniref:hypothetical protein n=1 Tax=unclassified Granulicatella TaxID=2630493 RepID=UPI00107331FB|nr:MULTISPECIES: hypothetical protein [unclassified Granulicatella]MBF0780821.1 hypothetical protein [Granulicatella sp. 19428wC4_WM01]TFU93529.1 hypothetical protein E4T68_06885 [Granulicatella sp. WM01]